MFDDIKKILEAVANKEITQEEAEMLIKALKEREKKKKKKKGFFKKKEEKKEESSDNSDYGETFIVNENDIVSGDVVLSSSKAIIHGTVNGDVVLIKCDLDFSGEVMGDLAVLGGRASFNGGKVHGDLVLMASKYSGKLPVVSGDTVRMSKFLASGIMNVVSLAMGGLGIKVFPGKKGKKHESYNVSSPRNEKEDISVEIMTVSSKFTGKDVSAEFLTVENEGEMIAYNVSADVAKIYGKLYCNKLEADSLLVNGLVHLKTLVCDQLSGNGKIIVEDSYEIEENFSDVQIIRGETDDSRAL